jgi:transposase
MTRGRPPKLTDAHRAILREIVGAKPVSTIDELCSLFEVRTGLKVHAQTLSKHLRTAGIERRGFRTSEKVTGAPPTKGRYGYTQAHRRLTSEQTYPSCLTDAEWALVEEVFEPEGARGTPAQYPRRLLVEACCYVVRTGGSWRMLPKGFPPWENCYRTFRRWSAQGKFERMHDLLRAQWREREGRTESPTVGILDAQSTRHSPQGGEAGYDAGKKVKGRKRHVVVDTLGLLLAVCVTAASVQDRDGAHPVIAAMMSKYPGVAKIFVDTAYAGACAQTVSQSHGIDVEVVRHPANRNVGHWAPIEQADLFTTQAEAKSSFVVAKRWIVERTHAWNERARRLVMHHDRLAQVSEAWVWLTEARLLLRRLTT